MVMSGLVAGPLFFSKPVMAPGPYLPDLTIWPQNITISPATPKVGENVSIYATIWNIGTADATNVTVEFYEEDTLIGSNCTFPLPVSKYWVKKTVDSTGAVGYYSSIAADSENGIHISYYDSTNGDLKYAYKPSGGSWNNETIDSIGDIGGYSSIAVDGLDGIHISYFDYTNEDLKYAYKPSGGSWTIEIVDSIGDVGRNSSIAVDGSNGVHISYRHDVFSWETDLKYAYKPSGGSWTNYTVDSIDNVGEYSSIDVDGAGGVHISYYDYTNTDLKYAYKPSGGNWTNYTADLSSDDVGRWNSIAVDSVNGVHISYCVDNARELRYSYKPSGGNWTNTTIDEQGNVGIGTSIAIDSGDGVHISYSSNWPNIDLKYAYKPSGGSWTTYTVDTSSYIGASSSIVIDGIHGIHISYLDSWNRDLRYANPIIQPRNIDVIFSWTPTTPGLKNITVKIDENNEIEELNETNNNATVSVNVEPGPLAIIEVAPQSVTLELNETQQFTATGYDAYNNEVPISPLWDANGGGTIDQNGLFTAKYPGKYRVYAIQSGILGRANVTVLVNVTADTDSDGMLDWWELNYSFDPFNASDASLDIDLDTLNNLQEFLNNTDPKNWDTDNDDMPDGWEINNALDPNNDSDASLDSDKDNLDNLGEYNNGGDPHNPDTDNDSLPDGWEVFNKLNLTNSSDVMNDPDIDGLTNLQEFLNNTDPKNWDTDNDDIPDGWEINNALDPINGSDATLDSDKDNLDNLGEYNNGGDPHNPDTDNDGLPDGWEVTNKLNLTNSSDAMNDPDIDGLTNLQEFFNYSNPQKNDTDGDNLGDGFEVIFSKTNASLWDTNGNGVGDGLEFIQSKGYLGWIQSLPDDWIGMTITWANYTILVKTNSSLLEGEFDKEEQKLKIKVSGPNGTQGVTEIDIPKSLCKPEDIEIKLDGELINYTLTEDETFYYIHIEYNHSVHELTASFLHISKPPSEPAGKQEGISANIYLMSLIIALIIIVLLSIVIIRNRGKSEDIGVQELPPEKLSMLLDKKHAEGKITDETYNDAKSLLEKYRGD
jgi:hypothetical protein